MEKNFHQLVAEIHENRINCRNSLYTYKFNLKTLQVKLATFKHNLNESRERFYKTINNKIPEPPGDELKKTG